VAQSVGRIIALLFHDLHNKTVKMCLLTDIAILDDSNVNTKETETKQFKDLEIKVSRMWEVRTKIVPVIIGALGKIKKGLDQTFSCPRSPIGH
jgi:hypothetical protein